MQRRLLIPGRGEPLPAADGFQLLGTVTTAGGGVAAAGARAGSAAATGALGGLWTRVTIDAPTDSEVI